MTTVDEHGELYGARPTKVTECVQRGTYCAAREENIIDQNNIFTADIEQDIRPLELGLFELASQIVSIQRDIEAADEQGDFLNLLNRAGNAAGDEFATGANSDDHKVPRSPVSFQDLMGKARNRAIKSRFINQGSLEFSHGHARLAWN
jgi:hypothetical protein